MIPRLAYSIIVLFTFSIIYCQSLHAQNYTLEFSPVNNAMAGQPFNVTVTGTSDVNDLFRLSLSKNGAALYFGGLPWVNCANSTPCPSMTASVNITENYPGPMVFEAVLQNNVGQIVLFTTLIVDVGCSLDYCPPNPAYTNFIDWMRIKGYEECITSYYADKTTKPLMNTEFLKGISVRPAATSQVMNINFYDVVPTDPQATYLSLGPGEGGNCQNSPSYPDFCPNPVPADYLFLEKHFERTFGMDVNFIYHRIDTSYVALMGQPTLNNGVYQFGSAYNFEQTLPARSILHWAIQTWNGAFITDMTGASKIAKTSLEPFNLLGAITITHEWGHTWNLPHSFVYDNGFKSFALDGVMGNTYPVGACGLTDVMDPIERYALEPPGGYLDEDKYVSIYNSGILAPGTGLIQSCGSVDPALLSFTVNQTSSNYIFQVTASNLGDIPAAYVRLAALDGESDGNIIESRILQLLPAGNSSVQQFIIPKSSVTKEAVTFFIDQPDLILNEDPNNNIITIDLGPCLIPTGLIAGGISFSEAIIEWIDTNGPGNYVLEYSANGGAQWTSVSVQGTLSYALTGLTPGTQYLARVKKVCTVEESGWSTLLTFNTLCPAVTNPSVSTISAFGALVYWSKPAGNIGSYEVHYRKLNTATWLTATTPIEGVTLQNLSAGTAYEFKVKTMCGNNTIANFSPTAQFTTTCLIPYNLKASNILLNRATLSWTTVVGDVGGYDLHYRKSGDANWTILTNVTTPQTITTLTPASTYEFKVKTKCASNESLFSQGYAFNTICNSKGFNANWEHLTLVSLSNVSNVTGNNGGYLNYTSNDIQLTQGANYTLTVKGYINNPARTEFLLAWIDFNGNGFFEFSERVMYVSGNISQQAYTANFTVPGNALTGLKQMRVSMKYGGQPTACEIFNLGEVEDYRVNINPSGMGMLMSAEENILPGDDQTEDNLALFPNPVMDKLHITYHPKIKNATVRIVDLLGRHVYQDRFTETIDVSSLADGSYILIVSDGKDLKRHQFIKTIKR